MDRGRLRSLSKECSGSVARDLQYSVYIHKMMSDASGVDNSTCGISAAVVVGLLHEEPEPIQWKGLHVRALRGINCERMQTLLTNVLLRLWGVAVLGFFMYQTAFADSLDALMACDVCQGFPLFVQDLDFHGDPQTRCGGISGGDEGCEGLRPRMKVVEDWVEYRKRTSWEGRAEWEVINLLC